MQQFMTTYAVHSPGQLPIQVDMEAVPEHLLLPNTHNMPCLFPVQSSGSLTPPLLTRLMDCEEMEVVPSLSTPGCNKGTNKAPPPLPPSYKGIMI